MRLACVDLTACSCSIFSDMDFGDMEFDDMDTGDWGGDEEEE